MNLGVIYKDIGKLNTALSYTLKAVELDPNDVDYHHLARRFADA